MFFSRWILSVGNPCAEPNQKLQHRGTCSSTPFGTGGFRFEETGRFMIWRWGPAPDAPEDSPIRVADRGTSLCLNRMCDVVIFLTASS